MRWETRIHWVWGFLIPSRWYLFALTIGGPLGVLIYKGLGILAVTTFLISILIITMTGLIDVWIKWTSFSLSISPSGKAFLERHGFGIIAERRINLNMIGTWTFKQSFMGSVLDYGSLSIGALGGPYEWEDLGNFRILRRIIENQGEWLPRARQNVFRIFFGWINLMIMRVVQDLRIILNVLGAYTRELYVEFVDSKTKPNYTRFLRFAETLLFTGGGYRYENAVSLESLSRSMFTPNEIRLYYQVLRIRKVVITNLKGLDQRHHRIKTLNDLQKNIPIDWFNMALKTI